MIQLLYTSSARELFGHGTIADILSISRANNARDQITGVLLYKSGSIMQVLEGDAGPVECLFEKLIADDRHHRVSLVYKLPISAREFTSWAMGFQLFETEFEVPPAGYTDLLSTRHGAIPSSDARWGARCLATFAQTVR